MITACFAQALQRCTSRRGVHFLLIFQEAILISKTRNQLYIKAQLNARGYAGGEGEDDMWQQRCQGTLNDAKIRHDS